jgi:hypothetical protein
VILRHQIFHSGRKSLAIDVVLFTCPSSIFVKVPLACKPFVCAAGSVFGRLRSVYSHFSLLNKQIKIWMRAFAFVVVLTVMQTYMIRRLKHSHSFGRDPTGFRISRSTAGFYIRPAHSPLIRCDGTLLPLRRQAHLHGAGFQFIDATFDVPPAALHIFVTTITQGAVYF